MLSFATRKMIVISHDDSGRTSQIELHCFASHDNNYFLQLLCSKAYQQTLVPFAKMKIKDLVSYFSNKGSNLTRHVNHLKCFDLSTSLTLTVKLKESIVDMLTDQMA